MISNNQNVNHIHLNPWSPQWNIPANIDTRDQDSKPSNFEKGNHYSWLKCTDVKTDINPSDYSRLKCTARTEWSTPPRVQRCDNLSLG